MAKSLVFDSIWFEFGRFLVYIDVYSPVISQSYPVISFSAIAFVSLIYKLNFNPLLILQSNILYVCRHYIRRITGLCSISVATASVVVNECVLWLKERMPVILVSH